MSDVSLSFILETIRINGVRIIVEKYKSSTALYLFRHVAGNENIKSHGAKISWNLNTTWITLQ